MKSVDLFVASKTQTYKSTLESHSKSEMPVDSISPISVVFSVFNFAIRGIQTAYEFASVPVETEDYLKTIRLVFYHLRRAEGICRHKPASLGLDDLSSVDNVNKITKKLTAGLEILVERAEVVW